MKDYRLLIFDADGTLFDYKRAQEFSFSRMCGELGTACTEELAEKYEKINNAVWNEFEQGKISSEELKIERFRRLFSDIGLEADEQRASESYLKFLGETDFLFDGAVDMLEKLKETHQLALLTNGIAATQHSRLRAAGIEPYFYPIVISEEAELQKPDPRIFEYLFERALNPDKEGTLMIGDSLSSDIAGGAAFGIDTCLIFSEQPGNGEVIPTYRVDSYAGLLELLG